MKVIASLNVQRKLKLKHNVALEEVYECFENRTRGFLEDMRSEHATTPPTMWFVAQTNSERTLKVVFMEHPNQVYEIKTAYEPNAEEERIYAKYS